MAYPAMGCLITAVAPSSAAGRCAAAVDPSAQRRIDIPITVASVIASAAGGRAGIGATVEVHSRLRPADTPSGTAAGPEAGSRARRRAARPAAHRDSAVRRSQCTRAPPSPTHVAVRRPMRRRQLPGWCTLGVSHCATSAAHSPTCAERPGRRASWRTRLRCEGGGSRRRRSADRSCGRGRRRPRSAEPADRQALGEHTGATYTVTGLAAGLPRARRRSERRTVAQLLDIRLHRAR